MGRATTRNVVAAELVHEQLSEWFEEDLHARRVLSLANATVGVITAGSLAVHAIGTGLARALELRQKHTIKQVDRLLSNQGIEVWELFLTWVPHLLAGRSEAVVAVDWTDFDADDQTTVMIHLISSHGRSTPLVWKTVRKSELKGRRAEIEDEVIARLLEAAPREVKLTLLADRGFADQELFSLLSRWEIDYVIRLRGNVVVSSGEGETLPAAEWTPPNGQARRLLEARITRSGTQVPAVVCVRAARMRQEWCLATSRADLRGGEVVKLYARRFTIEEAFRDAKNPRFGMGLSQARVNSPERRDRLLLLAALAIAMLTLLGAAGESLGYERWFKANTSKKRTYSLLRQGQLYYDYIPSFRPDELKALIERFVSLLREQAVFTQAFGWL